MVVEIVAEDTVVVVVAEELEVVAAVVVVVVVEALSSLPSRGTDHHPWPHLPPQVYRLSFIVFKAF